MGRSALLAAFLLALAAVGARASTAPAHAAAAKHTPPLLSSPQLLSLAKVWLQEWVGYSCRRVLHVAHACSRAHARSGCTHACVRTCVRAWGCMQLAVGVCSHTGAPHTYLPSHHWACAPPHRRWGFSPLRLTTASATTATATTTTTTPHRPQTDLSSAFGVWAKQHGKEYKGEEVGGGAQRWGVGAVVRAGVCVRQAGGPPAAQSTRCSGRWLTRL